MKYMSAMKHKLVDKNYVFDRLSAGVYLFASLTLSPLNFALIDVLEHYSQAKTLCLSISPYELDLSEVVGVVSEINRFYTSSEILNAIREFGKEENAKFVIINSYYLLESQEKWFLNNLLDLACRYNWSVIILEIVPTSETRPIPKKSKIKKLLTHPYNYSNKVYYILPIGNYGTDFQNPNDRITKHMSISNCHLFVREKIIC